LKQITNPTKTATNAGSPVSDDGRGLKPHIAALAEHRRRGSPVSDDGRGLKPVDVVTVFEESKDRPSVMTGVD
jgi:hypothetical protein